MILGRRSLRHMNGQPIAHEELMSLFEAARWAPSLLNLQVWRFVYAERNSQYWDQFVEALAPGNRDWAKDGAALVVVLSNRFQTYKGEKREVPTPGFDTGAATMALSLEGTARGLVVHATGGFDREKVAQMIGLQGDDYRIEAILVIGNRAYNGHREFTTQRHQVESFVSEGVFKEKLP